MLTDVLLWPIRISGCD